MICTSCGKAAKPTRLRFQGYDISGWRCTCGEEYFEPEEAQKVLILNKIKKKKYEVTVGQIKSNLIIRIPTELSRALGLKKGEKVKLIADKEGRFKVEL